MEKTSLETEVLIIGAGPASTAAAALLQQMGYSTVLIEKSQFPRFVIGESLLPQCMDILEQADLLAVVEAAHFQHKNGAAFRYADQYQRFDFSEKFSAGWDYTYQVERAKFDHLLAQEVERKGAKILYQCEVKKVTFEAQKVQVYARNAEQQEIKISASFVLDGSGYGRVLAKLLAITSESHLSSRTALFTHIEDRIDAKNYDRQKILITIAQKNRKTWYWLIPFANGRSSLGVVSDEEEHKADLLEALKQSIKEEQSLRKLLKNARYDTPIRKIKGYSCNVNQLSGKNYALLGNAGEFLDPVFSSGVTIALKSASIAVPLIDRQLRGETVAWKKEYDEVLRLGINNFRILVDGWYNQKLQNIIFNAYQPQQTKQMVCSLLAGYAWDITNPYVNNGERYLNLLAELCE